MDRAAGKRPYWVSRATGAVTGDIFVGPRRASGGGRLQGRREVTGRPRGMVWTVQWPSDPERQQPRTGRLADLGAGGRGGF